MKLNSTKKRRKSMNAMSIAANAYEYIAELSSEVFVVETYAPRIQSNSDEWLGKI